IRVGKTFPFGATLVPGGVNFSVFSRFATDCTLVLFEKGEPEPFAEIEFPDEFRIGNVWTMVVFDLNIERLEYGYRMDGPFDPSAKVRHPGTFAAIRDKIPYLKELGVNCIELLPIYEFDEWENNRVSPTTGKTLYNYWGYSTVGFFAPKAGYAATGRFGMQVD